MKDLEPEGQQKSTPDQEWADVLKINFTPPPVPGSTPPPIPEQNSSENPGHEDVPPMPSTYLIWSILTTVFCCFIPGIVAIIFSSQVSSRYFGGDFSGAYRASRMAEIWIIVSFVLGVLSATLYLPIMLIAS